MLITSGVMYLLGWGPLLAMAHFHIMSTHLDWSGAKAWRPAVVASAASIGLGQLAIALGPHTYLPQPEVHGVTALVVAGAATTGRTLGHYVARQERAEAALRDNADRFRVLVQDSSDIITVSTAEGDITNELAASNPAAPNPSRARSPTRRVPAAASGAVHGDPADPNSAAPGPKLRRA